MAEDKNSAEKIQEIRKTIRAYSGYKLRSSRIISIENIQKWTSNYLTKELTDFVAKVGELALAAQMIIIWGDIDRLNNALKEFRSLVDQTSYPGSTFFTTDTDPEDFDLDSILDFDFRIQQSLFNVKSKLEEFNDSIESALFSDSSEAVSRSISHLEEAKRCWEERRDKIVSFKFL